MSYFYIACSLPFLYILLRKFFNGPRTPITNFDNVMGKVILITGCSAGIGEFTAIELLNRGATVIFACRDEKKTSKIIDSLPENLRKKAIFLKLDLTSLDSVRSFVQRFSQLNLIIDIIINNAGVIMNTYERTKDNIETTFQSNHLSHMYLTVLLLKHLSKSNGRIINVSSNVHTLVKNFDIDSLEKDTQFLNPTLHSGAFYNYWFSKLANVYFTLSLSEFFEKNKINLKAVSLHPGAIRTKLFSFSGYLGKIYNILLSFIQILFFKDVEMGSQTTLHCCYLDYCNLINGAYYSNCKLDKMSNLASNSSVRKRFIQFSVDLIKMRVPDCPQDLYDIAKY